MLYLKSSRNKLIKNKHESVIDIKNDRHNECSDKAQKARRYCKQAHNLLKLLTSFTESVKKLKTQKYNQQKYSKHQSGCTLSHTKNCIKGICRQQKVKYIKLFIIKIKNKCYINKNIYHEIIRVLKSVWKGKSVIELVLDIIADNSRHACTYKHSHAYESHKKYLFHKIMHINILRPKKRHNRNCKSYISCLKVDKHCIRSYCAHYKQLFHRISCKHKLQTKAEHWEHHYYPVLRVAGIKSQRFCKYKTQKWKIVKNIIIAICPSCHFFNSIHVNPYLLFLILRDCFQSL